MSSPIAYNIPVMEPRSQHAQTRDGVAVAVWTLGAQEL